MSFIDFARIHGVEIDPNRLIASDRIKRCGTVDKPRSDNGAYFWDGRRGWVQNWADGSSVTWYQDGNAKPWTDEEKRAWGAKKRSAEDSQERRYQMTAQKADMILRSAKMELHNYLHMKGFPEMKGLVLDGKLLVPMRNVVTNILQGFQEIWWDGEERKYHKKMLAGMRAKHAVLWLGVKDAPEVWLVEGYATGLSLSHALRSTGSSASVVVCFSASNLVQVAPQPARPDHLELGILRQNFLRALFLAFLGDDAAHVVTALPPRGDLAEKFTARILLDAQPLLRDEGVVGITPVMGKALGVPRDVPRDPIEQRGRLGEVADPEPRRAAFQHRAESEVTGAGQVAEFFFERRRLDEDEVSRRGQVVCQAGGRVGEAHAR